MMVCRTKGLRVMAHKGNGPARKGYSAEDQKAGLISITYSDCTRNRFRTVCQSCHVADGMFPPLPEVAYVFLIHTPPQAGFSMGKPARVPDVAFLPNRNGLQYPRSPEGTAGCGNPPKLTGNSSYLLLP